MSIKHRAYCRTCNIAIPIRVDRRMQSIHFHGHKIDGFACDGSHRSAVGSKLAAPDFDCIGLQKKDWYHVPTELDETTRGH